MPGAVNRDIPNTSVLSDAIIPRTITTTTTGGVIDCLQGDGRCTLLTQIQATSITAMTVRVQQSTLTNSGFADITGASVSVTTNARTGFTFDRDLRYVQAVVVLNGTTAVMAALFQENLKTF